MKRFWLSAFTSMSIVCLITVAYAQEDPGQAASNACQDAVTKEVRGRYPQADRVQFSADDLKLDQQSNAETGVKGGGQFDSKSGDWTKFSFNCTYNIRSGETYGVSVSAQQADSGSGGGGSDGEGQDGDPESHAQDVCWQAVVKEARGKFAADGVEQDGELHGWQESNAETGVRGKGVAVTPSGARTKFKFKCTYNIRSGETNGVEIRAK